MGQHKVKVESELKEFVSTIKVLEDYPEVQSIGIHIATLPIADSKRKFSYLDDGVTNRQYALTIINLFGSRQCRIVEVKEKAVHCLS